MSDPLSFSKLASVIEGKVCKIKTVYTEDRKVRFIECESCRYRKTFMIYIPTKYTIVGDLPYKKFEISRDREKMTSRQIDYLSSIRGNLESDVASLSSKNICIYRRDDRTECFEILQSSKSRYKKKSDDSDILKYLERETQNILNLNSSRVIDRLPRPKRKDVTKSITITETKKPKKEKHKESEAEEPLVSKETKGSKKEEKKEIEIDETLEIESLTEEPKEIKHHIDIVVEHEEELETSDNEKEINSDSEKVSKTKDKYEIVETFQEEPSEDNSSQKETTPSQISNSLDFSDNESIDSLSDSDFREDSRPSIELEFEGYESDKDIRDDIKGISSQSSFSKRKSEEFETRDGKIRNVMIDNSPPDELESTSIIIGIIYVVIDLRDFLKTTSDDSTSFEEKIIEYYQIVDQNEVQLREKRLAEIIDLVKLFVQSAPNKLVEYEEREQKLNSELFKLNEYYDMIEEESLKAGDDEEILSKIRNVKEQIRQTVGTMNMQILRLKDGADELLDNWKFSIDAMNSLLQN